MVEIIKADSVNAGRRQRLRERFLNNEAEAHTDAALLELLLTYAIPVKDVRPLCDELLSAFGGLVPVLEASENDLCLHKGIKEHSAVLIKLVNYIRQEIKQSVTAETDLEKAQHVPVLKNTDIETLTQTPLETLPDSTVFSPRFLDSTAAVSELGAKPPYMHI